MLESEVLPNSLSYLSVHFQLLLTLGMILILIFAEVLGLYGMIGISHN